MHTQVTLEHPSRTPRLFALFLLSALVVLSTALAPSLAHAQAALATDPRASEPGSIKGSLSIKDSSKPAVGVVVTVRESGQSATTDSRGRFEFDSVLPGTYTLLATGEGYGRTRITDVVVRPGSDLSLSRQTIVAKSPNQEPLELEDFVVSAKSEGVLELDPYEVQGSKPKPFSTANIDLTRTKDDVLPFQTFSARDIELSGAVDVAQFLLTRVPQLTGLSIPEERNGNGNSTSERNSLLFRNWGGQESVVLVNGRRLPGQYAPSNGFGSRPGLGNFKDIPAASIERIEILSSAGSAIYGAGATGGVINIITKQGYRGGSVSLSYENPFDAHAPKRDVQFNYGTPLKWGWSLRVAASYADIKSLNVEDRADVTISRLRALQLARDPSKIGSAPTGATPNIISFSGNLFGPGTPAFTSVPVGYAGGQGITPFLNRQGVYNLDLSEGFGHARIESKNATFGTNSTRNTASVGLDKTFWKNWRASLEYLRSNSRYFSENWNTNFNGFTVPADAAINPFGMRVFVGFDDVRLHRPGVGTQTTFNSDQVTGTVRGQLGDWYCLVDFNYTRDRNARTLTHFQAPVNAAIQSGLQFNVFALWDEAFRSGAYNPFVDMRTTAPAAARFYEEFVVLKQALAGVTDNYQGSVKASGPLPIELPGGKPILTAGGEWLYADRTLTDFKNTQQNSVTGQYYQIGEQSRNVNEFSSTSYSAYAEANIPVVGAKQNIPGIERFEIFGSGRISDQEVTGFSPRAGTNVVVDSVTFRSVITGVDVEYNTRPYVYAAGFRYDMVRDFALRVSRSIGFIPPTISQVSPSLPPSSPTSALDKVRNVSITLSPSQYITGGKIDLLPEGTTSTNYGLIATPHVPFGNLRFSIDYIENVRDDAITGLGVQTVLDLEPTDARIAERVQRDSSGNVVFVDARSINFRQIASKSIDFSIEQVFDNVAGGRLSVSALATKNISFKVQSSSTTQPVEQVRNPSSSFSQSLEWNANGQVRWEGKRWTLGWSTRFFDDLLVNPFYLVVQGSDRAEWALEHDMVVGYRWGGRRGDSKVQRLLADMSLTAGIKNVFDREPRFMASDTQLGYAAFDSLYGRSFWLQLRKSF